jgi:hypothetical protein
VFFELALADLRRAAGLFAPVHARTDKVDGWVSLEVSPLLVHDTPRTVDQAEGLHRRAALDNLFIKIPGTREDLPAIEECICAAVPVNVTLLFSAQQYQAAAKAYLPGVERRIQAGLNPAVASVASLVPGDPVLEVTDRLLAVTGPYQGHRRMTLTYPALARAEEVMWLVTGRTSTTRWTGCWPANSPFPPPACRPAVDDLRRPASRPRLSDVPGSHLRRRRRAGRLTALPRVA